MQAAAAAKIIGNVKSDQATRGYPPVATTVYPFNSHTMAKERTLQVNECRDRLLLCENEIDHLERGSRRAPGWIHIHIHLAGLSEFVNAPRNLEASAKSSTSLAIACFIMGRFDSRDAEDNYIVAASRTGACPCPCPCPSGVADAHAWPALETRIARTEGSHIDRGTDQSHSSRRRAVPKDRCVCARLGHLFGYLLGACTRRCGAPNAASPHLADSDAGRWVRAECCVAGGRGCEATLRRAKRSETMCAIFMRVSRWMRDVAMGLL